MSKRSFSIEDYQLIRREMREALIDVASSAETVTYSELGRMLKSSTLHHRNPMLYELLRDICDEERQNERPNLCALVVRKSDGIPGAGFFVGGGWNGEDISDPIVYWEDARDTCWAYYSQDKT